MRNSPNFHAGGEKTRQFKLAMLFTIGAVAASGFIGSAKTEAKPPKVPNLEIQITNNTLSEILKIMRFGTLNHAGVVVHHPSVGGTIIDRYIATNTRTEDGHTVYDSFVADVLPGAKTPYRSYLYEGSDKPNFNLSENYDSRTMLDHGMLPDESYNLTIRDQSGQVTAGGALYSSHPELEKQVSPLYDKFLQDSANTVYYAVKAALKTKPAA